MNKGIRTWDHRTPLMQWSLHKYKYLWSVGGGGRVEIQISRREFHINIHLDQGRVEILYCIKKHESENLMKSSIAI